MIDLKEVIKKYPECLESSEKLKAYLTDLYPSEKAKVSIIVDIFESGLIAEIKKSSFVDNILIVRLSEEIERIYGHSQKNSQDCLKIWASVFKKNIAINTYEYDEDLGGRKMYSTAIFNAFKNALDDSDFYYTENIENGSIVVPQVEIDSSLKSVSTVITVREQDCYIFGVYDNFKVSNNNMNNVSELLMRINQICIFPQLLLDYKRNMVVCHYRYEFIGELLNQENAMQAFLNIGVHLENCGNAIMSVALGLQSPTDAAMSIIDV